jgi:hypothetical protein
MPVYYLVKVLEESVLRKTYNQILEQQLNSQAGSIGTHSPSLLFFLSDKIWWLVQILNSHGNGCECGCNLDCSTV